MIRLSHLKRLWRIYRSRPIITVSDSGWATPDNHLLTVGVSSRNGITSVCSYRLDPNGPQPIDAVHAQVEERARTLSHILGYRVLDTRPNLDAHYRRHAPKDWVWQPRDARLWNVL